MKIASLAVLTALTPDHSRARQPDAAPVRSAPQLTAVTSARQPGFADSVAAALDLVPPAGASAQSQGADEADRTQAVAEFAQALWQAMHENAQATGEHRQGGRKHHDHGERVHGWNRNARGYAGLVQQIERLISRYAVESGAAPVNGVLAETPPPEAGTEPPAAPAAVSAELAPTVPSSGAAGAEPAAPVAAPVAAAGDTDAAQGGLDVSEPVAAGDADEEPADRLPVPDPLMASFQKMLEAFGIAVPATDSAGAALTDFLNRLVAGMRDDGRERSSCGGFVSVTA